MARGIFLLLLLGTVVVGCKDEPLGVPTDRQITVTVVNAEDEAAHLFIFGESFPCCKVNPAESRSRTISVQVGDEVLVKAGRNGVVLISTNCRVTNAVYDSRTLRATFSGSGWAC